MLKRILKTTAFIGVFALVLGMAGAAQAFPSGGNPGNTGPNTITWTGNGADGGVPNTEVCPSKDTVPDGIDPNSYLHWIFTTNGGSASGATLHLGTTAGGNELGDFPADAPSGSAFHFFTPYYTPDTTTLFAYADFTVGTTGNGAWNLNISHGCPGEQAKDLKVTKTAIPSFTRTFNWTIDKSADTETVYSAGGGESTAVIWTVAVTKDGFTDSDWVVNGTITIANPNDSGDITLTDLTDVVDNGGDCTVDAGPYVVPAIDSIDVNYSCTYSSAPSSTNGKNTATATWDAAAAHTPNGSASGSADFAFDVPATIVNDAIDVTDSNGNSWHFTDSDSKTYSQTFNDPAGTCTPHKNTATITQTGQSAEATVSDCQGADLTVTKTATPSFDRKYIWHIDKSVDKKYVEIQTNGGTATFNYKVEVGHDAGNDSNWAVNGTITITNPNDWQEITLTDLTDVVDNGGDCTVDDGPYIVPASDSIDVNYSCTYSSAPSSANGKNTATAKWDADGAHTPSGSASGDALFAFVTPTTKIDECVSVNDPIDPNSPHNFCVGDTGDPTFSFTYSRTVNAPALGTCVSYDNTATFTTYDTGTEGSDSETVKVCRFNAPLTIGYWKTHLAKTGTAGWCTGLPTGTGCSNNGPWVKDLLNKTICDNCTVGKLGNHTVDTSLKAANVFNANNCSNASTSDSNAAACLAAQLLAAQLNVANGANSCICDTIKEAKAFLTAVGYNGPGSAVTFTAPNTRAKAIDLKTQLDNYNNNKGCPAPPA